MCSAELFVRVVRVETWCGEKHLTNASGFFYLHEGFMYLITNRHVVRDDASGHTPDSIHFRLHTNADDLTLNEIIKVPLYLNGTPQWKEHPVHGAAVDVVAVSINDPTMLSCHYMDSFESADIVNEHQSLIPGQPVLIVGFPLGFNDTYHNLPIVRQAVVASDFGHPFKGEPYFLTDARLHRGMSGAPIVTRIQSPGEVIGTIVERWCLLGVHSAALDVSDRDPVQDDRLGLNCTWYARLIPEIVSQSGLVKPLAATEKARPQAGPPCRA